MKGQIRWKFIFQFCSDPLTFEFNCARVWERSRFFMMQFLAWSKDKNVIRGWWTKIVWKIRQTNKKTSRNKIGQRNKNSSLNNTCISL